MAVPGDPNARRFYRAAVQRLEDAEFLLETERTTAAVYLAGYCVECLLKALILAQASRDERAAVLDSFRGAGAHNYDWLWFVYAEHGGARFPKEVTEAFLIIDNWGTDLRYNPGTIPPDDAERFLDAVRAIHRWANGRL